MPYTFEDHHHRLAAWAASTSASASPLCRFKVSQGIAILEASGFDANLSNPTQLPEPKELSNYHRDWRNKVIEKAGVEGLYFTHGVAAKIINCYLKVRFICGGSHLNDRVKALHPPIDEVLLKELASINFGGKAKEWRKLRQKRWSKFDSTTYEDTIEMIRESLPQNEPLWKIEEHWQGHQ
jgi:hypothetical protein